MTFTLEQFHQQFTSHGIDPSRAAFVCALSGGLDSMVLLDAMARLKFQLRCIHVHHGLSPDADQWAGHCQTQANQRACEITIRRISMSESDNLEERLRQLRYQVIADEMREQEIVLTGHHRDDQAETVLLQLLRGAGVSGLSAMPEHPVSFYPGQLFRPLLAFSHHSLQEYAHAQKLSYIDDSSNDDERFDRNYLRHSVIVPMRERWPALDKTIARSARAMHDAQYLLEELAHHDVNSLHSLRCIDFTALARQSERRIANALRYWVQTLGVRVPNRERLLEAVRQFRKASEDKTPELRWADGVVQKYRHALYYFEPSIDAEIEVAGNYALKPEQALNFPDPIGRLHLTGATGRGLKPGCADGLEVRFRQGGESMMRDNGSHQPLKHWFQESGIPPRMRGCVPLLFWQGELIAVADTWIDARFLAREGDCSLALDWHSSLSDFMPKD